MVIYGAEDLERREQAYELLARGVRLTWGLDPMPALRRAEGGKPCFADLPGLEFNLSHSGSLALCALDRRPVGVDIQVVKQWRPGLPGRVCAPEELAWLEGAGELWPAFTALWVLKESRAKYTGRGLTVPIRSISVPLPRPGTTLLSREGLWFRLYAGPDWRAAVCADSPPPPSILWRELPPKGGSPLGA